MKPIRGCLAFVLGATLMAAGCSKDEEVRKTLTALDTFTVELVQKVKAAPNPSTGVEAAQKYLDENKADIAQKLASIKGMRGFQVSEETKKKLESSFMDNASKVAELEIQYVGQAAMDAGFRSKLEKLVGDYKDVLTK